MRDLASALAMFRCPATGRPVELIEATTLERLNEAIAGGNLETVRDEIVDEPMEAALRPEEADFVYPVRDGVPDFSLDERIRLDPDLR